MEPKVLSKNPKIIALWCPKGGVGKSSRTRELAYSLSTHFGKNVLVTEFDDQLDVTKFFLRDERIRQKYNIRLIGENIDEVEEGEAK